ncbi:MAG: aldolase [Alphaproteobacteria bacterium]
MDERERQGRIDLAAALRWACRLGLNEGVCNHFSLAVNDDGTEYLINPQGFHWSELTAGDMMRLNVDGRIVSGKHTVEPTAFHIHGRLHARLPHATAALHTHMPYATALTCLDNGRLEPTYISSLRFHDRIAYDEEFNGVALSDDEGDRIARAMGNKPVCMMGNHGVMVTGRNMAWAFDTLYYLERAAQVQVLAMSTGKPLRRLPEHILDQSVAQIEGEEQQVTLHFDAIKRILDREEPEYRTL